MAGQRYFRVCRFFRREGEFEGVWREVRGGLRPGCFGAGTIIPVLRTDIGHGFSEQRTFIFIAILIGPGRHLSVIYGQTDRFSDTGLHPGQPYNRCRQRSPPVCIHDPSHHRRQTHLQHWSWLHRRRYRPG